MKKNLLLAALAAATMTSAATVYAGGGGSDYSDRWYVGATLGNTDNGTNAANHFFNPEQCVAGVACSADDSDNSASIFGGYQFNEHFAVEFGYTDLGNTADFNAQSGGITVNTVQDTKAFSVAAIGKHQLGHSRFSAYGKAGLSRWKSDISFDRTPNSAAFADRTESKNGVDPLIGVGLEFKANERWNLRAGWDRHFNVGERSDAFDVNNNTLQTVDTDVDVLSIGATVSF